MDCARCGGPLTDRQAGALYCSRACRQAAYRHQHPIPAVSHPPRACEQCATPLDERSSPKRRFCNDRCRRRAQHVTSTEQAHKRLDPGTVKRLHTRSRLDWHD